MNYEALGRYHALNTQRATLLAEIRVAAPLFAQLQQQTTHSPPTTATLLDSLEQATAILPRLRQTVQRIGELSQQMDALREQYNLTP